MDLIGEGAEAELDLEAVMFALAAPGALTPLPDAAIEALVAERTATVIGGYLDEAPTAERIEAFVESSRAHCAQTGCERWRTRAVERLAP